MEQNNSPNKTHKRRKVPHHNDYVFKRYQIQQNRVLNEKSNQIQYQFQPTPTYSHQLQSVYTQNEELFIPTNIINFQDELIHKESNDYQPNFETLGEGGTLPDQQLSAIDCQNSNVNLKVNSINKQVSINNANSNAFERKKRHRKDPNQVLDQLLMDKDDDIDDKKQFPNLQLFIATQIEEEEAIKGLKIQVNPDSDNVQIQITDKKKLVESSIPPGIILKCIVKRSNNFLNMINPQFDLYLNNGLKHILSAKKYSLSKSQVFRFSTQIANYEGQNYVGSIKTNTLHNQYWLISNEIPLEGGNQYGTLLHAGIVYQKINKKDIQRNLKIVIVPNHQNFYITVDQKAPNINMKFLVDKFQVVLKNLEMKVVPPSQKNLILVDDDDEDYHYLKFQKQSDNIFSLEIQHPLSPMQAMAIVMTRFDAQLK